MLKSNIELERSSLSPEQIKSLKKRFKVKRNDFHNWYFDGQLTDCFIQVFRTMGRNDLALQLITSIKDQNCTKEFYDSERTFANLNDFLDPKFERKSMSWSRNCKVAVRLLREQLSLVPMVAREIYHGMNFDDVCANKDAVVGSIGIGSKGDNEDLCIESALKIMSMIKAGERFSYISNPTVPGHRSQISKYVVNDQYSPTTKKEKNRLVFAMDGGTSTLEASFALNQIDYALNNWFNYAALNPVVLRGRLREFQSMYGYSIDYSNFDHTVQWWVIKDVFAILKECYDDPNHYLDWIEYNFIHTKVLVPGDKVYTKHRGIPSGSMYTQLVGTMCNAYVLYSYLAHMAGEKKTEQQKYDYVCSILTPNSKTPNSRRLGCFFMGDDSCIFTNRRLDLEDLSKYVDKVFGMTVSVVKTDKWNPYEYPKFLKREWRINGEYRNVLEVAINSCHPERRTREKAYGSGKFSPWHIMYGLYCTYPLGFLPLGEQFFLRKMKENGGAELLYKLDRNDRPGVFRAFPNSEWISFVNGAVHRQQNL